MVKITMIKNKYIKKLFSGIVAAGVIFVVAGIQIILTGRLRAIINLEEGKYFLGGVLIVFGMYMIFVKVLEKDAGTD